MDGSRYSAKYLDERLIRSLSSSNSTLFSPERREHHCKKCDKEVCEFSFPDTDRLALASGSG
eukprot:scaffold10356_cov131-Skeletonema_dohrnii-CCMP3373.AAC.1